MFIRLFMASILLLVSAFLQADTLKPFVSDGCSAFPDGTLDQKNLWLECCKEHDYDYWQGGTHQQRLDSDKQLEKCVTQVGEPTIAALMLAGVRVGGTPYIPTSFRWGYGWSYPRLYGVLSLEELAQVAKLSAHLHFEKKRPNNK